MLYQWSVSRKGTDLFAKGQWSVNDCWSKERGKGTNFDRYSYCPRSSHPDIGRMNLCGQRRGMLGWSEWSLWTGNFWPLRKAFYVIYEGKRSEGLRLSENTKAFRVSISLWKDGAGWLLGVLQEFYWTNGGKLWGRNKKGRKHNLWVALGRDRRERVLVLHRRRGRQWGGSFYTKEQR